MSLSSKLKDIAHTDSTDNTDNNTPILKSVPTGDQGTDAAVAKGEKPVSTQDANAPFGGADNLKSTGGVDLTLKTLDAQKAVTGGPAGWSFKDSGISMPAGFNGDTVYPTRELAIAAYVEAWRISGIAGSAGTQTIDSSTNKPTS